MVSKKCILPYLTIPLISSRIGLLLKQTNCELKLTHTKRLEVNSIVPSEVLRKITFSLAK